MPSAADETAADETAADEIAAAIEAAGGALRFDRFLDLALYGEHGFYTGAGRAGRRGDFITSPEVGPLFGTVLAEWIRTEYERLGRPDDFTVFEVGAGPGTLARSITNAWAAAPHRHPHHYVAVELSAAQRESHPEHVRSVAEVPTGSLTGVIIANELLDNLPFRLAVFDRGWREAFVAQQGDRFVEVLRPLDEPPVTLPPAAPSGARVPMQERVGQWVRDRMTSLQRGSMLVFDYVTPTTVEVAFMPWRAWLRTYLGHERGAHYLADPGEQDITAQVVLDQLPEPQIVRTQAQFLMLYGIDELVDEGRRNWEAAAAAPTVAAMTMRSRVREAEALLDVAGLGGFLSMVFVAPEREQ